MSKEELEILWNLQKEFKQAQQECLMQIGFCNQHGMKLEAQALLYKHDATAQCWLKLCRAIEDIERENNRKTDPL